MQLRQIGADPRTFEQERLGDILKVVFAETTGNVAGAQLPDQLLCSCGIAAVPRGDTGAVAQQKINDGAIADADADYTDGAVVQRSTKCA